MQRSEFSKIPSSSNSSSSDSRGKIGNPETKRVVKERAIRELSFVTTEVGATYFEETWQDAEESSQLWSTTLDSVPQTDVLIQLFLKRKIFCLASGEQKGSRKYYFYARESKKGPLFMAEVTLSIQTCNLSVVLRVKNSDDIPGFQKVFSDVLYCLEEEEDDDENETVEL